MKIRVEISIVQGNQLKQLIYFLLYLKSSQDFISERRDVNPKIIEVMERNFRQPSDSLHSA